MLQADSGGLVSAADRVRGAASALRDVDTSTPFTSVAQALPGSQVSDSCMWVSTRLGAAVQVWADRLDAVSSAATTTASDLDLTDQSVAVTMQGGMPR